MNGCLAIILHAHLPFVRHPEHEHSLEEQWFFEALTECYLPLLQCLDGWLRDGLPIRLTFSMSPTLCAMLLDPLLRERYRRHLDSLIDLAEKELFRTHWDKARSEVASFYQQRFLSLRARYQALDGNLIEGFRRLQNAGLIEIITTSATHAVLPLLEPHPQSLRAQIQVACDYHRACFGHAPVGFWLPECAYAPGLEDHLAEAGIKWFVLDTHGLLQARPRPRFGVFAPVITPTGVAAFGRDPASARQVWSRNEGYPGEPAYRDFYRDIGFDLDLDYLDAHLPVRRLRSFTGLKFHRITGPSDHKQLYDRSLALRAADTHARHFLKTRQEQTARLAAVMKQPPVLIAPYDAELFGHWWFEGPEFLDRFVRKAAESRRLLELITPTDYLRRCDTHLAATPNASTWGEGGHLQTWLNHKTAWLYPSLRAAQKQMAGLAQRFHNAGGLARLALQQAARELLLAQSSDWPFIISTNTSPDYARQRFNDHISKFSMIDGQLRRGAPDADMIRRATLQHNLFPDINPAYWA